MVLAILALFALSKRVRVPVAIVALVWAAATLYVGIMRPHTGIVQVIHPLLGIGAIGLAEMLGGSLGR